MQGFSGNIQQNNYPASNRQAVEDSQRRQQMMRANSVQQDGTPQVKLFAQSLTALDPMQQQQQQHSLMAGSRNSQHQQAGSASAMQQASHNMPQARNPQIGPSSGHYYQQGVNQTGGSFLQNSNDPKRRQMWSNYDLEPGSAQVDVPAAMPGSSNSILKNNNWNAGGEVQGPAENDNSLVFGRSKIQQNIWGGNGMQQNSSQSSGDLDSRHRGVQSGHRIQHGTSQPTDGHSLASQPNGSNLQRNTLGTSVLDIADLENRRSQELQNCQEDGNWRDHSLMQASPQQAAPTNSSLQAFAEMDRTQTTWKNLWQSVNPGNSGQLVESDKVEQSSLWGQSSSHVGGSQPLLPDGPNARVEHSGWSGGEGALQTDTHGERELLSHQPLRDEQQFVQSGSPQPTQAFQDGDERQLLANQGPNLQEALSHASMSDNEPSSASRHVEQSYQQRGSFSHSLDRSGNQNNQNSSDPVGHSSGSRDSMHFPNLSIEQQSSHQSSLNKAELQHQGRWSSLGATSDSRQTLDEAAIPTLESSTLRQDHPEGRVQLQLSNQQTENRFSHLMNVRSANLQEEAQGGQALPIMNAVTGYRHQTDLERSGLPNGALENPMSGWAQGQVAGGQSRTEQSKLGGRALQTSSVAVSAGKVNELTLDSPFFAR
jgi:hypothetical protein